MKSLKVTLFFLIITFFTNSIAAACDEEKIHDEIKEILQLAIDLPLLQQFFHNRTPLTIEESDYVHSDYIKGLKSAGKTVQFMSKNDIRKNNIKHYLTILTWDVSSFGINAEFEYKVEGIIISYEFKKDYSTLKWNVENSTIIEH